MTEKTTVLVIFINKRVKSIVFALSIKFCDESGDLIAKLIDEGLLKHNYK